MVKYGCLSASHRVQVPRTSLRPNLGELLSSQGGGLQWIWRSGQGDEEKPGHHSSYWRKEFQER